MKNAIKIFLFIFILIFCGASYAETGEKERLSEFISAFTESELFNFDLTDEENDTDINPVIHFENDEYLQDLLIFGIFHNRDKIKNCSNPECYFGKFTLDKKFIFDTVKEYFGIDLSKKNFSVLDDYDDFPPIPSEAYDGKLFHFGEEIFSKYENSTVYLAEVSVVKEKGKNLFLTGKLYDSKNKSIRPAKFEAVVKPVKNSWNIISMRTVWDDRFPDLGRCTADKVRLRENPNAKSKIIGQVNKNDSFVLLDANEINGEKWYLIDNPTKKGKAWIFGKYVGKYYELKDSEHTPAHVIGMQIILDYGVTPEKTRALHGKPLEILRDIYGNFTGLRYDGFEVSYHEEAPTISNVAVGMEDNEGKAKRNFGPIKIGDDTKKLREIFGKDIRDEETFWTIDAPSGEVIYFNIDDNTISSMQWLIEEH